MLGSQWMKDARALRREARDMEAAGWEWVGEGGGKLWELYRGHRIGSRIMEAKVGKSGLGIWVRIEEAWPLARQENVKLAPAPPPPVQQEEAVAERQKIEDALSIIEGVEAHYEFEYGGGGQWPDWAAARQAVTGFLPPDFETYNNVPLPSRYLSAVRAKLHQVYPLTPPSREEGLREALTALTAAVSNARNGSRSVEDIQITAAMNDARRALSHADGGE